MCWRSGHYPACVPFVSGMRVSRVSWVDCICITPSIWKWPLTRSNTKQMFLSTTKEPGGSEELLTGPFFGKEGTQLAFWGILRPYKTVRMYCSVFMCEVWAQLYFVSISGMSAQQGPLSDVRGSGRMQHTSPYFSNLLCWLLLWFSLSGQHRLSLMAKDEGTGMVRNGGY